MSSEHKNFGSLFSLMDQVKSQTTEVLASLDRRTREIMGNSSQLGVLQDGQVQTELLHKEVHP
jgi:hypothetical protein